MDFSGFEWKNPPREAVVQDAEVALQTQPNTDLWQRTYYGFSRDNAPMFLTRTDRLYFTFAVTADFSDARTRFDQCGIAVYMDSDNWVKASTEYIGAGCTYLGSVVTNGGYSDWATQKAQEGISSVTYQLSRRKSDFLIEYSTDGSVFSQMRIFRLHAAKASVNFGIYACSPEDSSFEAVFTRPQLTECVWGEHR